MSYSYDRLYYLNYRRFHKGQIVLLQKIIPKDFPALKINRMFNIIIFGHCYILLYYLDYGRFNKGQIFHITKDFPVL